MIWKFTYNENNELIERKAISVSTWGRVKRDAAKDPNVRAFEITQMPS